MSGSVGGPSAFLEAMVKLNAMSALCPSSPAPRPPRGGHVEAGASPCHPPAGDDPGGSAGDHPHPPCHRAHRRPHHPGDGAPLSRPAPPQLRCRLARRRTGEVSRALHGMDCRSLSLSPAMLAGPPPFCWTVSRTAVADDRRTVSPQVMSPEDVTKLSLSATRSLGCLPRPWRR
jgi:hypothetical protein